MMWILIILAALSIVYMITMILWSKDHDKRSQHDENNYVHDIRIDVPENEWFK